MSEKTGKLSLKMLSKQQWVVVILLGLLLVVIAMPTADRSSGEDQEDTGYDLNVENTENGEETSVLEGRLAAMLGGMEGVGQVQVMIYTRDESGLISQNGEGEIQGVLIVAEGADDSVTVRKIQESVMALFQLEAHKIKVMKMK